MTNRLLIFLLFCCASSTVGFGQTTAPAKPLSPFEHTMIAAEQSFIAAAKKGDSEYFKRTLVDDYSLVGVDGQSHDRQEVLGELGSGGVELTPYNLKVVELGEGAAIVTYDLIMLVPPSEDQGPPPRYQHWTSVWVKLRDAWKLKFQQTTPTHWGDW